MFNEPTLFKSIIAANMWYQTPGLYMAPNINEAPTEVMASRRCLVRTREMGSFSRFQDAHPVKH